MKSDNAIRNSTSIFVGIIVAIAAFVRGALLLPLLLVACSVWGLYVLQHLRGSLTAVPKKKAKAPRRAKFVVPDIEDEPLSDILLLHVNQRVTAARRTAGSNITWEWATKDPLAIVKEGGRCLIRVHGLDSFESAEVVLDKQAHLRCELINTVPLRPNPTAGAPEKPRIDHTQDGDVVYDYSIINVGNASAEQIEKQILVFENRPSSAAEAMFSLSSYRSRAVRDGEIPRIAATSLPPIPRLRYASHSCSVRFSVLTSTLGSRRMCSGILSPSSRAGDRGV